MGPLPRPVPSVSTTISSSMDRKHTRVKSETRTSPVDGTVPIPPNPPTPSFLPQRKLQRKRLDGKNRNMGTNKEGTKQTIGSVQTIRPFNSLSRRNTLPCHSRRTGKLQRKLSDGKNRNMGINKEGTKQQSVVFKPSGLINRNKLPYLAKKKLWPRRGVDGGPGDGRS